MKFLVLVAVMAASFTLQARSIKPSLEAQLTRINLQKGSTLEKLKVTGGNVYMDFLNDEVSLRLNHAYNCPAGRVCAAVMPVRTITVKHFDHSVDNCGRTIYTASEDDRPVDGVKKTIVIIDHSTSTCPRLAIFPAVNTTISYTVEFYNRIQGIPVKQVHTFQAKRLR